MGMMLRRNIKARAEKAALANKPQDIPKKEEKIQEEPKTEAANEVEWTAEEIKKMPFMKLKSVAKQNGVEVKDKEASEIRADLIERLGL